MARCKHGFEPTAVKCPMGCHGPVEPSVEGNSRSATEQAKRTQHARTISTAQIVEAVKETGALERAARQLGINPGTISNRARTSPELREALGLRDRSRTRHPGFVDMTGQVIAGWTVLGPAPGPSGNARWRCQHSCGQGVEIIEGIRLRNHPNKYCHACRPKRPGTVTRRAR